MQMLTGGGRQAGCQQSDRPDIWSWPSKAHVIRRLGHQLRNVAGSIRQLVAVIDAAPDPQVRATCRTRYLAGQP